MSILGQIKKSQLSKQGRTNTTGQFEGTPANVGASIRGQATAIVSPATSNSESNRRYIRS